MSTTTFSSGIAQTPTQTHTFIVVLDLLLLFYSQQHRIRSNCKKKSQFFVLFYFNSF